jgi:hypothetical protein
MTIQGRFLGKLAATNLTRVIASNSSINIRQSDTVVIEYFGAAITQPQSVTINAPFLVEASFEVSIICGTAPVSVECAFGIFGTEQGFFFNPAPGEERGSLGKFTPSQLTFGYLHNLRVLEILSVLRSLTPKYRSATYIKVPDHSPAGLEGLFVHDQAIRP